MTEHDKDLLELLITFTYLIGRYIVAGWIAYITITSSISTGWQTLLIALVIVWGLGCGLQYKRTYGNNGTSKEDGDE